MFTIRHPLRTPQGSLVSPIADGAASPMAPDARARSVGAFILVAHFDATFTPGEAPLDLDVRPHPHIGIATLSYLFSGAVTHRDGLGNVAEILPGDVAWMVTGRGVVHSERVPALRAQGGRFHGLQIWVALSKDAEECDPSFAIVRAADVRVAETAGVHERRLLDRLEGAAVPRAAWISDVTIAQGATYQAPASAESAVHVVEGTLDVEGRTVGAGETATFGGEDRPRFVAMQPSRAIAFGGDAAGPRYLWWNYVHSSRERIEQAKAQWRAMRLPLPPDDRDDVIPLPADHERPLRAINAP